MPLPRNTRFRYKQTSENTRVRLAYSGNKLVEVSSYRKRNGVYVRSHTRRIR